MPLGERRSLSPNIVIFDEGMKEVDFVHENQHLIFLLRRQLMFLAELCDSYMLSHDYCGTKIF